MLNPLKPLFLIHPVGQGVFFLFKVVFLFYASQSEVYFPKKKGGDKHCYPNTIQFKLFHPYFQNGDLSGKLSIPLELSNGFLFRVIRRLKISVSKNHPVEEKWWFGLTALLVLLVGRVP